MFSLVSLPCSLFEKNLKSKLFQNSLIKKLMHQGINHSRHSGSEEHFELLVKKMLLRNRLVFVFVCFCNFLKASTG